MHDDASPTARALLALELIQNSPGITAERLARRLAVSERAVRRYVGILREADVPIDATRGPYGGYRVGRGHRVPPLMFTDAEALGLVMAVLEGHHAAGDPDDPAGRALAKIVRVLPTPVAAPADAVRQIRALPHDRDASTPDPATTALLVQAGASRQRLRLGYRPGPGRDRTMVVDPWAVVVRHGRWYLLCQSHPVGARRLLRIDRVFTVELQADTFTPPPDFDPVRTLEEHLSEGWKYQVDVVVEASAAAAAEWIPRSLGRLEPLAPDRTRLLGSTEDLDWYARQLMAIEAPFRIVGSAELREAAGRLADRLGQAAALSPDPAH